MNSEVPLRPAPITYTPVIDDAQAAGGKRLDVDLRLIWSAFYRNRLFVAVIVAVAVIIGLVVTMLSTPMFQATASIQIEQQSAKVLDTEDTEPVVSAQEGALFLQTQVDILRSRALAVRVAEELGLTRDDRFLIRMHRDPSAAPIGTLDARASRRERVLQLLQDNLLIKLPTDTRVAQISFRSPDPALSATIANAFAEGVIVSNLQRKFNTSAYARRFLEDQLRAAKSRLEASERAAIAYARDARLIDASNAATASTNGGTTGPRSLTVANMVQLGSAYSQARSERVAAQQRWQQAARTPIMDLPEVLSNPTIQSLVQARSQAQANYDQERKRRKPEYPSMEQLTAQIASFDRQINQLAGGIRASIRNQYLVASHQETALAQNVEELKSDTLNEQDRSVRFNILQRESDTNRTMYDGLLQRFKEVSAAAGLASNNISIVDRAEPPLGPYAPRPLLNLALAALAGLALASILVFVKEQLDDAVRSPEDVQRKLDVPFLNSIPALLPEENPQVSLADPRSVISEAYYALRTALELTSEHGTPHSLLFASSRAGEGKTTSAYAIARDFARIGKKVVIIDADLRKPSLHRLLGLSMSNGLVSVLARHRTLDEVLQPSGEENLDVITCGPRPPNPAELLSGTTLPLVIRELRERYDMIVIDGPPVLGLADAVLLARAVESVVFIVEANASHRGHARAAIRRLISNGARLSGVVLTKFNPRSIGYGETYGYSYNYGGNKTGEI